MPVEVVLAPAPTLLIDDVSARELLSPTEVARADRYVHELDARNFRASRAILRLVLASRLGHAAESLEFSCASCRRCGGPHGKPFVAGPLQFSFSRTGGLCGIALSDDDVGLDVEAPLSDAAAREIAPALAAEERGVLSAAPNLGAAASMIWVRKEAVLKCTGDGLNADLRSFSVARSPVILADRTVWVADLSPGHGIAGAVATSTGSPELTVSVLDIGKIGSLFSQLAGPIRAS